MHLARDLLLLATGAPAARAAEAAQGVRHLYLIRHGIYDRDPKADDRTGNGLNALGREQARLLGARLRALPVPMTTLVSSDLTRARETAREIGRALEMQPVQDALLGECTPRMLGSEAKAPPGDDPAAACEQQLQAAWARYARPSPGEDARDVLVCHGNVIRWFAIKALGADTRRWTAMNIGNASLTVISVRPDGSTSLDLFSDVGHLPPAKQTWAGPGPGWLKGQGPGRSSAPLPAAR